MIIKGNESSLTVLLRHQLKKKKNRNDDSTPDLLKTQRKVQSVQKYEVKHRRGQRLHYTVAVRENIDLRGTDTVVTKAKQRRE